MGEYGNNNELLSVLEKGWVRVAKRKGDKNVKGGSGTVLRVKEGRGAAEACRPRRIAQHCRREAHPATGVRTQQGWSPAYSRGLPALSASRGCRQTPAALYCPLVAKAGKPVKPLRAAS